MADRPETADPCADGSCREDWCSTCWADVEAVGVCSNCGRQSFKFEGDWHHNDGALLCIAAPAPVPHEGAP